MDHEERFRLSTTVVQQTRAKVSRFWVGPIIMSVTVSHPDTAKIILKEPKNDHIYRLLKPWIGDGLLVSSGIS